MTRVLLLGGSGQLGTEIRRSWTDCTIHAPGREALEFEDSVALEETMAAHRPDVVVNCTAFHEVDRCEETVSRAFETNALAVERAARLCRDREATFVTVSTDYVFDGKASRPYVESDAPHPISAYGASKLAGELLVERLRSRAFVVRTCGLYGMRTSEGKGHTFVDRVITQARSQASLRIVSDVVASPTFAGHLASTLRSLIRTDAYGLYHAANVGAVSWYDFASEALRQAGIDWHIEAIRSDEWKAAARRPMFSALENAKLRELGIEMPDWKEGIASYLERRAVVER